MEADANTNLANNDGITALMAASLQGHVEVLCVLLEADANPNLANNNGDTALTSASYPGHVEGGARSAECQR